MKVIKLICISLFFIAGTAAAQTSGTDSIRHLLEQPRSDSARLMLQVLLSHTYLFGDPDSAIGLSRQVILQAQKIHFNRVVTGSLNVMGQALRLKGDLPQAMETHFDALRLSRSNADSAEAASSLAYIGAVYVQLNEYPEGLWYFRQTQMIRDRSQEINILSLSGMGDAYEKMDKIDSSLLYQQEAYNLLPLMRRGTLHSLVLMRMGIIETRKHHNTGALRFFNEALNNTVLTGDLLNCSRVQSRIAGLYYQAGQRDSSLHYGKMAWQNSLRVSNQLTLLTVSRLLVKLYRELRRPDSAFYYQEIAMTVNDSLFGPAKFQRLQLLALNEQQSRQQLLDEQRLSRERFEKITWVSALFVFLAIAFLLWRGYHRQKSRTRLLQATLAELKETQVKVLENEKMAATYRQQLGIQQVRNAIASELHDDIGATLSSIHLYSEVAKKQINTDSRQALPMLEKIESSSQEMMQAMSDIVWSIQSKNDDLEKLVEKIHAFASQLFSARNIMFRFDCPDSLPDLPLAMESRRNVYLVCKEVFNNIIRHAQATEASMEIKLEEKTLWVTIDDNGCGFNTGKLSDGNGLPNLYQRAAAIGGSILIDSRPLQGTRVCLYCPLA